MFVVNKKQSLKLWFMKSNLSFAIVGCGRIAQRHAEQISNVGRLVAVCDIVEEKSNALALAHHAKAYTSIEQLLANEPAIDVVAICTPNGLHAQHTILALQAGCHVVCEKPMAIHTVDCAAMIAAADSAKKHLFVVKQNRFNPPVLAVKDALDKNVLGKIHSIQLNCFWNRDADYYSNSWKGSMQLDGGTLFTQFSHFIDLMYWMVGDVKAVQAITANYAHEHIIEFEDTGVATVEFVNGAIGSINYTVNSHAKNMEGSITLFAEKGTVKIGGQYLNILEYAAVKDFSFSDIPAGNVANNYGTYTGSMSNHDKVYQNVQDVLTGGGVMKTSMQDGLKTVEIIEKIYQSAKQS